MKVLVTGSRGYIGSTLCKTLGERGHIAFGVDRELRPEGSAIYGLYHRASFEDPEVAQMVYDLKIDTICHLAADASVPDSITSPSKYYTNNVSALIQFLDNLVKLKWKGKFIFSSSAAVYPSASKLASESDPTDPMNPYGLTKLMGEQILQDYYKAYGISVVCFRYFNVAGAWDDVGDHGMSDHVIQKMISSVNRHSDFNIYGTDKDTPDGTCIRDYLHVRDVCGAHLTAIDYLDDNHGFHVYNLGTGNGTSVKQLAINFIMNTGRNLSIQNGESRDGDPDFLVADGHRFVADTGYTYNHSDINNIIKTAWKYSCMKNQHYGF